MEDLTETPHASPYQRDRGLGAGKPASFSYLPRRRLHRAMETVMCCLTLQHDGMEVDEPLLTSLSCDDLKHWLLTAFWLCDRYTALGFVATERPRLGVGSGSLEWLQTRLGVGSGSLE
ncbi:unnamed protein product [Symbiodinium sp. CCMP2592]|nr:unnamed protein product [Symbiodinium sp. CCMP2592]